MERPNRFSEAEWSFIQRTFGGEGGEFALKALRKVFLPSLDTDVPPGQFIDLWQSLGSGFENMSPYDRELAILARVKLIQHLESCLLNLANWSSSAGETPEERTSRQKKDSSK